MANIKISELDELGVISFQDEIPIVDVSEKETKKIKIHQFSEAITPLTPMPIGSIFAYGGETAPDGYLFANGQEVSRTEYAELFEVYGETYGFGDYETTFNVPNLCGKVIVGFGEALDSTGELRKFENLGEQGGEFRHQLTIGEMPSHTHNTLFSRNSIPTGTNAYAQVDILGQGAYGTVSGYTGQGQAHNNMQPYLVTNYIIKAKNDSKTFTDTVVEQTEEFNQHVNTKLNEYNQNASDKTDVFNLHVEAKTNEFNTNASEKVEEFNSNAENKVNEFNSIVDEVIPQLESEITELQTEVNELKNNVLTNEVEGTSIHVDDSANARVLELGIDGNSYQETRSGKNLLSNSVISETKNGITCTKNNDGSITFKGTSTGTATFTLLSQSNFLIKGETYTLSTKNNVPKNVYFRIGDVTSTNIYFEVTENNSVTFQYDDNFTSGNTRCYFWFGSLQVGSTFDFTVYPMLEKNDKATEYEQYGASPSPDYPSEVEVVKGYNLFDKNNANKLNAYISPSTNIIANSSNDKCIYIPIVGGNTYTVTKTLSKMFRIGFADELPTIGVICSSYIADNNKTSITISSSANNKYLVVDYWVNTDTLTEQDILDSIQIVEGTILKPYVPYKNIGFKTTGKNLLDIQYGKQGSIDATTGNDVVNTLNGCGENYIKVRPNTQYVISANKKMYKLRLSEYSNDFVHIKRTETPINNDYLLITTTENTYYLRWSLNYDNSTSISMKIFKELDLQLEQGNVATTFEPYQENITYIDLQDNEICKVGDIKDELDLNTGILTKRIGKMVLDGSESWSNIDNTSFYTSTNFGTYDPKILHIVSDYFKGCARDFVNSQENYITMASDGNIRINMIGVTTAEDFKSWLSENNVTVYYQLAAPYEVQLGKIEKPKTINHVTNINLLATLETNMKIKYVRSANVVIENLAKAIIAMGGEV